MEMVPQGFVAVKGDITVIAFRGTELKQQILADLNVSKI